MEQVMDQWICRKNSKRKATGPVTSSTSGWRAPNPLLDRGRDEAVHMVAGFVGALVSSVALAAFYALLLVLSAEVAREGGRRLMVLVTERWWRLDGSLATGCQRLWSAVDEEGERSQNDFEDYLKGTVVAFIIFLG
jgi:hypothetical protein